MHNNHERIWPSPSIKKEYETPHWEDGCGHKPEEFVAGAEYWAKGDNVKRIDVYVFGKEDYVCIRTGNWGGDYISPGTVIDLITAGFAHQTPEYLVAMKLIDERRAIRVTKIC